MRLVAGDAAARRLGLLPGLGLADARARVPHLAVADHDPAADAAFLARLADACDRYTPLVALDGADGLILDIAGVVHLFGGEAAMKRDVEARLARAGVACVAAVAGTPDAARALARFGGLPGAVVPPGGEPAAVGRLPAAALGLDHAETVALARLGLRTVGDVAERPRAPLAARFGQGLIDRLDRVLGRAENPIVPRRPVPVFAAERRFAEPVGRVEDCAAALKRLAQDVCRRLERQAKGGRRFEASFFRTDGAVRRIAVATAAPLREPEGLGRLLFRRIDSAADPLDPGFGFDAIRLAVLLAEPMAARQDSFGARRQESAVSGLADRLGARFGEDAAVRFDALDTHIPERAERLVPLLREIGEVGDAGAWVLAPAPYEPRGEPPERPLRLFNPPQPLDVVAEVPDGAPKRFRWRRVLHEVAHAEGPERISAEWWRGEGGAVPTRDYFRVEDTDGRRFWVFRAGLYGVETTGPRWFLHGLFA